METSPRPFPLPSTPLTMKLTRIMALAALVSAPATARAQDVPVWLQRFTSPSDAIFLDAIGLSTVRVGVSATFSVRAFDGVNLSGPDLFTASVLGPQTGVEFTPHIAIAPNQIFAFVLAFPFSSGGGASVVDGNGWYQNSLAAPNVWTQRQFDLAGFNVTFSNANGDLTTVRTAESRTAPSTSVTPEPATLLLMATGITGIMLVTSASRSRSLRKR
jgi:hypothetical protein